MPWSKNSKTYPKTLVNKKKIRLHAQKLHELKIKRLLKPEMDKFNGIISYQIISTFSRTVGLTPPVTLLILLMDFYKIFVRSDAWLWGIYPKDSKLTIALKIARDRGYIEKSEGGLHNATYYHTIKGKQLMGKYNDFYKKSVKRILKSNAGGNIDVKYANKSVRLRTPKVNTGSDQAEGIKYQRIAERE